MDKVPLRGWTIWSGPCLTGPLRGAARFGRFVHQRPRGKAGSEPPVSSVLGLLTVLEVPQPLVVDAIAPARTAPLGHRRIEPESGDDQECVARIRVDREPVPLTVPAPPHEPAGVHRGLDEVPAVEGVADRPRAVVTARLEVAVAAAVAVRGAPGDLVCRPDHLLDPVGRTRGCLRPAVHDLRVATAAAATTTAPAIARPGGGGPASARDGRSQGERHQRRARSAQERGELDPPACLPSPGKNLSMGAQNHQSPSSACGVSCRAGAKGAAPPPRWVSPNRWFPRSPPLSGGDSAFTG